MADSTALRSRRKRLHARGDHSICRHQPAAAVLTVVPTDDDGGDLDVQATLQRLARDLSDAYARDPGNSALARELRMTLVALRGDTPDDRDDGFAQFLADVAVPGVVSSAEPRPRPGPRRT